METFRSNPPASLGGQKVTVLKDYSTGISKELATGNETSMNFPKSNVLQFITENGGKISVRPSGTEPKIKFYFSVNKEGISGLEDYFSSIEELKEVIGNMTEALDN